MTTEAQRQLTFQEYLILERQTETRSDYLAGQRFARAGSSREHVLISGNILHALQGQLVEDYEVYNSTMRLRTPSGLVAYPDGSVACPRPQFDDSEQDTLLNPILIVEVLSKATEVYDHLTKFVHYRTIPSLAEVLLVAEDRPRVEHWARLPLIDCKLPLATIYRRVLA